VTSILFVLAIGLAGYSGYSGMPWHWIFISSSIMAVGYVFARFPTILSIASEDGFLAWPKLIGIQILVYSVITVPVYFAAAFFS